MKARSWVTGALVVAVMTLVLSNPVLADLLYDNGAPIGNNGNEMTTWIQAEDFTFGTSQTLTGIRFWAMEEFETSFQGSIVVTIYMDAATGPGGILSRDTYTPTRTFREDVGDFDSYQFDIEIVPLTLTSGTYWLGLHNGPLSTTERAEFYWEGTTSNTTRTGHEDQAPFDTGGWFDNGNQHAFQLFGTTQVAVPEPSVLLLFASGLMGVLSASRRRLETA